MGIERLLQSQTGFTRGNDLGVTVASTRGLQPPFLIVFSTASCCCCTWYKRTKSFISDFDPYYLFSFFGHLLCDEIIKHHLLP